MINAKDASKDVRDARDAKVFAQKEKTSFARPCVFLCVPLRQPLGPLRQPLRPLRLMNRSRSTELIVTSLFIFVFSITISAQRKPSEPTRPFVVLSSQSLHDLQKELQTENKTAELIDSAGMQLRVAVQHEKNKTGATAELHDASDHVYYVLEGSATLILGGKLAAPKEIEPGEWRSPRIIDGQTFEIKKSDLVIVPRGTPHQRNTAGKNLTMILITIYAAPLQKRP